MTKLETARGMFLKGYNCAQAIVFAFKDDLGLSADAALKISCGLGAGMARKGEVCGGVTAGIMVLGMRYGRGLNDDAAAMETTYAKTRELMALFASKHGSCHCRQLLNGCDLTTRAGQDVFNENDYLHQICLACVQTVVEILNQLDSKGMAAEP